MKKRVLTLLLAFVMVLGISVPAFAAGDGSITITNATQGKDYAAYKIFDATYVDPSEGDKLVSYTIDSSNPWFALVKDGADSPFTLTQVRDTTTYNVAVAEGKTDADVISWLKGQTVPAGTTADASAVAADTTVVFTDLEFGYYYITSTLGSAVTITSAIPDVSVVDKNQSPDWETPEDPDDPEAPEDPDPEVEPQPGKNVSKDGYWYKPSITAGITDTAYFKVNAFVPKYNDDKAVYEYTFTDTLGDGFTYIADSISVTINGDPYDAIVTNVDGQEITVKIPVYTIGADYPADASVEIKYEATVDKDAVYDNMNEVSMDWTEYDPGTPEDPKEPSTDPDDPNYPSEPTNPKYPDPNNPDEYTPTPPDKVTNTYVFGFNLQKYAKSVAEDNKLDGAEFKLYDAETEGTEILVVAIDETAGTYRVAEAGETGVPIKAGFAKIFGLDVGTYYLEEVTTPDGYNPLVERQEVTLSASETTDGYVTDVDVINNSGTVLPGTGGIGTTIFYIIGGVVMLAAAVILISRKRISG